MPKHKISVFDAKLNEYLYDKFSKLTSEQLKSLSSAELRLINIPKNLRKFIAWGTWEKKYAMCTKVGIPFAVIFWEKEGDLAEMLTKVYKQHTMKRLRVENIEEMLNKGVFVSTSKEFALSLGMLAQNCHSDVYYLNQDYKKVSTAIAFANSSIRNNPLNTETGQIDKAMKVIAELVYQTRMTENYIRVHGLEMVDTMILLYLFKRSNNYVQLDALQRGVQGEYSPRSITVRATGLFQNGYIDKLPSASKKAQFTITAKGINFITDVMFKIVDHTVN